jgi:hypothetical protein
MRAIRLRTPIHKTHVVQEAALPVLYAVIEFDNVPALQKFVDTVQTAAADGRYLVYHMRTFAVRVLVGRLSWRNFAVAAAGLVAILPRATGLRVLDSSGIIALNAIPVLSRTCSSSLHTLMVGLGSREVHSALLHLHLFQELHALKLDIREDAELEPPRATTIPAWSFPFLESFCLDIVGGPSLSQRMLQFLNTCAMTALRWLSIWATIENGDVARSMVNLCLKLPQMTRLDISIPTEWHYHVFPHIRVQMLHVEDPDRTLVAHLSPTVRCLRITSKKFEATFYDHLWTILNDTMAHRSDVQDVHLPPHFSWPRDPDPIHQQAYTPARDEDVHLPQLLRYAVLFSRRGMNLRDGQGNTLADYLRPA